jgi:predicted TIM-barrel fold metal-dependent hydrolase
MLGTDYPYVERSRFRECVSYIEETGLPREQVDAILDRNAQALLKLPERKA